MNFEKLKNFVDYMVENRTVGAGIEVYLEGKQAFRYTAGYSEQESKTPLTGDELFHIYSCSKVATVTAGLQLLEQGKMKLSDTLSDYIPEFKHMQVRTSEGGTVPAKNPILIEHLFTMTAGFSYNSASPAFEKARKETKGTMDTVSVIRCLAEEPLCFEPGTHWQYSLCHDVLAAVISVISGKPFREYMQENIFNPLEMKSTYYHLTSALEAKLAAQYRFVARGQEEDIDLVEAQKNGTKTDEGIFKNVGLGNSFRFGPEYDSGGAGITTTLSDYSKFLSALAGGGMGLNGNRILKPETVEMLYQNRLNESVLSDLCWEQLKGYGYSLGVRTHLNPVPGKPEEFGWCGAAGASAAVDTKRNMSCFFVQHVLNPREEWYLPRLMNTLYECLEA